MKITPEPAPARLRPDWRDDILRRYTEAGFRVHNVAPKPPEPEIVRTAEVGECYDYSSQVLPLSEADEVQRDRLKAYLENLRILHGSHNVATTLVTGAMELNYPGAKESTHTVILVRHH